MKRYILIIFILLINNFVFGQEYSPVIYYQPIRNSEFILIYDPAITNVFHDPKSLTVLYTFDYWDKPFSKEITDSILIAKCTNSDRKKSASMIKKHSKWEVKIQIPASARILSFIVTDGNQYDLNNKKTFASYIFNNKIKPVREACAYMMQLYGFTQRSFNDQLEEIKSELELYPANFTAYYFYWRALLYKEMFQKEIIAKVKNEIRELYDKYKYDPEACGVIVKVFHSGILRIDDMYDFLLKIPENLLDKESWDYIQAEKVTREFNRKRQIILGSKAPDFETYDIDKNFIKLSEKRGKVILLYFCLIYPESRIWTPALDSLKKLNGSFDKKDFETYVFYSNSIMKVYRASRDSIRGGKDTSSDVEQILKIAHAEGNNLTFIERDPGFFKDSPFRFFDFCLIDKNGDVRFLGPHSSQVFFKRLKQDIIDLIKKK